MDPKASVGGSNGSMTQYDRGASSLGGIGRSMGEPCEKPTRPEYEYESAARLWTAAKERLDTARSSLRAAEAEQTAANEAERDAWGRLESTADRGPQQTKAMDVPAYNRGPR